MKNLLFTAAFGLTLIAGVGLSSGTAKIIAKIDGLIHRDCARWDAETLKKPLFSYEELKKYNGEKLRATKNTQFSDNHGKLGFPVAVGRDKFLFLVHWCVSPEDGIDANNLYDKDGFEKFGVEIVD